MKPLFHVGDIVEVCLPDGVSVEQAAKMTLLSEESINSSLGGKYEIIKTREDLYNEHYTYHLSWDPTFWWIEPLLRYPDEDSAQPKVYNMSFEELFSRRREDEI